MKRENSSRLMSAPLKRRSSSQAPLIASHISTVSAVRTARALSRGLDAGADGGRVVRAEGEEVADGVSLVAE
jgi:hypothetical protein